MVLKMAWVAPLVMPTSVSGSIGLRARGAGGVRRAARVERWRGPLELGAVAPRDLVHEQRVAGAAAVLLRAAASRAAGSGRWGRRRRHLVVVLRGGALEQVLHERRRCPACAGVGASAARGLDEAEHSGARAPGKPWPRLTALNFCAIGVNSAQTVGAA
jgi:hypothetical protein